MASGRIRYDAGQHRELEAELTKIENNFSDLITELGHLKSSVDDHLEGQAATSLSSELSALVTKLQTEKENWSTVSQNAHQVEQLIKEADDQTAQAINDSHS